MITAQDYLVVAAAAGGALAQRFRRHEPSISSALWITAGTRLMLAVCPYYGATFVVELQASLVMVTSLYIYIALYRLLFHPLNRFPGPRIAAVSQLYTFRHRLLRQEVFVNETLHERYGDVVRIGPNHLIIRDASALQTTNRHWLKGKNYDMLPEAQKNMSNERDPARYRQLRRPWEQAFTARALDSYEAPIQAAVGDLSAALTLFRGASLNLSDYFSMFVWDVMSGVTFGNSWGLLRKLDFNQEVRLPLSSGVYWYHTMAAVPWAYSLGPAAYAAVPELRPGALRFHKMCMDLAKQRRDSGPSTRYDLWSHLAKEVDGKPVNTDQALRDTAIAIFAGTFTSVNSLIALFWRLLSEPRHLAALREVVEDACPGPEPPTISDVVKIPLLLATVKESLRFDPPLSIGTQRTSPPVDTCLGEGARFVIPPNTEVTASMRAISRDPQYFGPDAGTFRPSRWLDGSPISEDAFAPFSIGPSACVGRPLAMQVMQLVVATLVKGFDLSLASDFDYAAFEDSARDSFVVERVEPLRVVVKPL